MKKILALLVMFSITASTTLFLVGCKKTDASKFIEKDLNEVIKITNLGKLKNKNKNTILKALKDKDSDLDINEIEIKDISENDAIIRPKPNSTKYKGQVNVTYRLKNKLSEVIKITNLGGLENNNEKSILNALKAKNSSLDINEIEIKDISETSATIIAKPNSTKYKGQVNVTYRLKNKLSEVIKITNLGGLENNNEKSILNALKAKNSSLDINEIEIKDISETSATIIAKPDSTKYKGQVNVTYRLKNKLSEVIKITNLGGLENNNEKSILNALKAKNPSLDINEIEIKDISETSATIIAKPNSTKYKGQVNVTYNIRKELSKVIIFTNLGMIEYNDKLENILREVVKAKNPSLDTNEIEIKDISNNSAIIIAKPDSTKYKGQVKVTYIELIPNINY